MTTLAIAEGEALPYAYEAPTGDGVTFVFVNALTGDLSAWEQPEIGPALRAAGHGTLAWNFRGQAGSRYGPDTRLAPAAVAEDLHRLLAAVAPPRPLLVGLSIGGLFAAQALLSGATAEALVLINTLRRPGLRLDWINRATATLARRGGTRLVMEANLPMLVHPDTLAAMRAQAFTEEPYRPLGEDEGLYRLLAGSIEADWDLSWERLAVPVLVMTGRHDRVFRVDEDVAALTARLPQARSLSFEDAGHLIPMERPDRFAAALLDFAANL